MITGISSACFYPAPTEEAVAHLVSLDCPNIEIFLNSFSELRPEFVSFLKGLLAGSGTRVVSLHPFTSGMEGMLFFSDYDRRFWDGVELYKRYLEIALELEGRYVVFHGAHKMANLDRELYAQRYGILHEEAKKAGGLLLHENVERSVSRDPGFFRYLGEQIPDAGFVLDVKQAIRAEEDPLEMLDAMAGHLRHVHISDNAPGQPCLAVGGGTMDMAAFLRALRSRGYDEALILELYSSNYETDRELTDSLKILDELLEKG